MDTLGYRAAKRIKETREFIAIVAASFIIVTIFVVTIPFLRPLIAPQRPLPSITEVARVQP